MKQDFKKLKKEFNENGFVVIKKLFSSKECKNYRKLINQHFNLPSYEITQRDIGFKTFLEADGVTKNKNFWDLIFKKELLNVVKILIGKEICYTQHSDLHINSIDDSDNYQNSEVNEDEDVQINITEEDSTINDNVIENNDEVIVDNDKVGNSDEIIDDNDEVGNSDEVVADPALTTA